MKPEFCAGIEQNLTERKLIPLDKSWIIRMGVLDFLNGRVADTIQFLEGQNELGGDLQALHRAALVWESNLPIDVGESATLYRFLRFTSLKLGLNKEFIKRGTLLGRELYESPGIEKFSLEELAQLKTSQWVSAAILLGNEEQVESLQFKSRLTHEALEHWQEQRAKGQMWLPRYDQTIMNQAMSFMNLMRGGELDFTPEQAEDYCFARVFGVMTKVEGEVCWPSLHDHESDRLEEMETMVKRAELGLVVNSGDHRVVQAIAMKQMIKGEEIEVTDASVVNKSWPQFWRFLAYVRSGDLIPK